MTTSRAKNVES